MCGNHGVVRESDFQKSDFLNNPHREVLGSNLRTDVFHMNLRTDFKFL